MLPCGRFIPACAGNAAAPELSRTFQTVHPRMRGERCGSRMKVKRTAGSSPHARGTHDRPGRRDRPDRFIPACAGNASSRSLMAFMIAVHPRMRGERRKLDVMRKFSSGSSPHARGTLTAGVAMSQDRRFIPACAGNASPRQRPLCLLSVHPRMRGERIGNGSTIAHSAGSSPHARGTLFLTCENVRVPRFIPACAGNARSLRTPRRRPTVHPRMRGERTSNKLLIYRRKSEPSDSTKHSGC